MTESDGQLFDLGYQHYEGPREGRMRARKALFVNGVRTRENDTDTGARPGRLVRTYAP